MRQLLGGQLLPGMDTAVQAPAPKPAIAADPVPPDAPRNGTSASPAATTVQPVQSAAHQPTQVSPAPAQAQQRPVNGGSAATAQAATKQAANGKEDDEDWWTE